MADLYHLRSFFNFSLTFLSVSVPTPPSSATDSGTTTTDGVPSTASMLHSMHLNNKYG